MPIDTLKSKRRLVEEYGLDDRQAEGIVELIAQSEERGATASDVDVAKREVLLRLQATEERLEQQLESEIAASEQRLESKIVASEQQLDSKITSTEKRLGKNIEQLRLEMEQMRRQMLQWMLGIAAFITVLLTLFEYVL
ncbi:hypothetical protein CRI93_11630 [Longimonas halophila]|uniref:DUF1640 domain-containing protein n=1 Tax=Longimonas halophila TaxID=1469170 RepID=A0A2H3NYN3_9BACT|nr:DUF1640 domain-containing protein [Longimonas halophila]PEN05749.1 hypothetical protein CRI93_11630 [Longimonas halophila]